jgi:hypothetical protein
MDPNGDPGESSSVSSGKACVLAATSLSDHAELVDGG